MQTHEISMLHRVTRLDQPQRIPSRPTSDVGDDRRRGRKPPPQNFLGALKFDCTFWITQPVPLLALRVMRLYLGILRTHAVSLSDHQENRETFPWTAAKVPQAHRPLGIRKPKGAPVHRFGFQLP
jgi:hypothetical protein